MTIPLVTQFSGNIHNKAPTSANTALSVMSLITNRALTVVRPNTKPGIEGFVFDIPTRENVTLSSESTDNYTESNKFIHEHRVIKPVIVELEGLVAELVITQDMTDALASFLKTSLAQVNGLLLRPTIGTMPDPDSLLVETRANMVRQEVFKAVTHAHEVYRNTVQIVDKIQNFVKGFDSEGIWRTRQERAFKQIEDLHNNHVMVSVLTPWKYFPSMSIESVTFDQIEDSNEETSIKVILKEMRFSSFQHVEFLEAPEVNNTGVQEEAVKNIGNVKTRDSWFLGGKNVY